MNITVGMTHTATATVNQENTASTVGSGKLPVFATPMMIALMERAAAAAIQPALEEGRASVGTALSVTHSSATPVGMQVWATATVTGVDRSRVEFEVSARDEAGEIGSGTHTRFVVETERFLQKAQAKKEL